MHRIPDAERLTQRLAINTTEEEYRQACDEAAQREIPPTTFARQCFLEGFAILRRKGIRARSMQRTRKGGKPGNL